jgi:hypothetical protein
MRGLADCELGTRTRTGEDASIVHREKEKTVFLRRHTVSTLWLKNKQDIILRSYRMKDTLDKRFEKGVVDENKERLASSCFPILILCS